MVLTWIINNRNNENIFAMSQEEIARVCGLSVRSVYTALKILEKSGAIVRQKERDTYGHIQYKVYEHKNQSLKHRFANWSKYKFFVEIDLETFKTCNNGFNGANGFKHLMRLIEFRNNETGVAFAAQQTLFGEGKGVQVRTQHRWNIQLEKQKILIRHKAKFNPWHTIIFFIQKLVNLPIGKFDRQTTNRSSYFKAKALKSRSREFIFEKITNKEKKPERKRYRNQIMQRMMVLGILTPRASWYKNRTQHNALHWLLTQYGPKVVLPTIELIKILNANQTKSTKVVVKTPNMLKNNWNQMRAQLLNIYWNNPKYHINNYEIEAKMIQADILN